DGDGEPDAFRWPRITSDRASSNGADPHLGARSYLRQYVHVAERLAENIAGARQSRFVAAADRRAAKAERDSGPVGPIGDLAGRHHRARLRLARDRHRYLKVDLLAPGERGRGDRQRGGDRAAGRGVEQLGVERDRTEVEANTGHPISPSPVNSP